MDFRTFQLDQFVHAEERPWYFRLASLYPSFYRYEVISVYRKNKLGLYFQPPLDDIGKALGFTSPLDKELLHFHDQRINSWGFITHFIQICFILILGFIGLALLVVSLYSLGVSPESLWSGISVFLLMWFITDIAITIARLILERKYADSLTIATALNILCKLKRDSVLIRSDYKTEILHNIDDLARYTQLLSLRYSNKNDHVQSWTNCHFKRMEKYLRQQQESVIAPTSSTLDDLRDHFYRLTHIYITGMYGDETWPEVEATGLQSITWKQRFRVWGRVVLVVGIPVIVLILIQSYPLAVAKLGVDLGVLTWIMLAWFVLAFDAIFKLGAVANVVNLAKTFRDLK